MIQYVHPRVYLLSAASDTSELLSRDVISRRPLSEDLPPADLLEKLVNAYFEEFNIYYPLLHRPTFEQAIRDEVHVRDDGFCAVVLLVCANGSRWVEDDRLQRNRGHPPGLHWFERAGCVTSVFLEKPQLHDLQALIVRPTSCPSIARSLISYVADGGLLQRHGRPIWHMDGGRGGDTYGTRRRRPSQEDLRLHSDRRR